MLEIQQVQHLPDGRSVIKTIGGRRFKVLSTGMRDGYNTALVEFIKDVEVTGEFKIPLSKVFYCVGDLFKLFPCNVLFFPCNFRHYCV